VARVIHGRLETPRDLTAVETVNRAQLLLDRVTKDLTDPRELPRRGGLVLAEHTSSLGQRELLAVVTAEPQTIAIQAGQSPEWARRQPLECGRDPDL
jgi:hypothetical protein